MAAGRLLIGAALGSQSVIFTARNQVTRLAWNSRLYCTSTASSSTTPGSGSTSSSTSSTTPGTSSTASSTSSTTPGTSSTTSSTSSTTSSTSTASSSTAPSSSPDAKTKNAEFSHHPFLDLPVGYDDSKERFIPISRRSLVGQLMQQKNFLTSEECKRFEEFAVALDSAIDHQFHGVLSELKVLFDPLNPDRDTISLTRTLQPRERLDNEFWMIQKLGAVMEKANFHEIPKHVVTKALSEHLAGEGVRVSVNQHNYDVLHFWALGRHLPVIKKPWYKSVPANLFYRVSKRPSPPPVEYYRRVVVAVRAKGYTKLLLKMFKEIPTGALEHLLPDGKIQMSKFDQSFLASTIAIGSLTILIKGVTFLADINVQWTLIVASITGVLGLRAWNSYKNRRTKYVSELSRTLYFKNIANNRGLLTLLVDRAQDESFKEALLTYAFLLAERPPSHLTQGKDVTLPGTLGGISGTTLERRLENWVFQKCGAVMEFDCSEAVKLLTNFGMLRLDVDDNLYVVNLDAAINALPLPPVSIAMKADEETELDDCYEEVFFETNDKYKKEEKQRRQTGWS